jgi:transcriptional regulator with XRE-family HTH domain
MTTRDIISKNITCLRKKNKMTQGELADKLFYSNKAVSKWERGESLPDAEMLQKIADLFNVPIEYLFKDHDYTKEISGDIDKEIKKKATRIKIIFILTIVAAIIVVGELGVIGLASIFPSMEAYAGYLFILPFIPLTVLLISIILGKKKYDRVLISLTLWSLAFSIYFFFQKYNFIFIYEIAFLLQLGIIFFPYIGGWVEKSTKNKKVNKKDK